MSQQQQNAHYLVFKAVLKTFNQLDKRDCTTKP